MRRIDRHQPQSTPTFDQLARQYGLFIKPRRLGQVRTNTPLPPTEALEGKA